MSYYTYTFYIRINLAFHSFSPRVKINVRFLKIPMAETFWNIFLKVLGLKSDNYQMIWLASFSENWWRHHFSDFNEQYHFFHRQIEPNLMKVSIF